MKNYFKYRFCEKIPKWQLFSDHFSQPSKTKSLSLKKKKTQPTDILAGKIHSKNYLLWGFFFSTFS